MKVKIFTALDNKTIFEMEEKIGKWLVDHRADVKNTQIALCQQSDRPVGERSPCFVVTVWYQ